ncbi:EamA family transporter, partial [Streptomyces sp. YS-3]|uniref:EamA family transporter n=1 Tax=Streptomyces sp. YS-3 TaxID=3381352 RepID=UPI0038622C34
MTSPQTAAEPTATAAATVSTPEAAGGLRTARGRGAALAPVALVVSAGISVQFGSAVAVMLMPRAGAAGVVTLRLAAAALVLLVLCRPKLRGYRRADWGTVVAFGAAMAGMNGLFYQAVDRIPLGTAVTLEVLGPLALSVLASRRLVNFVWAGLALAGVALLGSGGGDGFGSMDLAGAAFALGASAAAGATASGRWTSPGRPSRWGR